MDSEQDLYEIDPSKCQILRIKMVNDTEGYEFEPITTFKKMRLWLYYDLNSKVSKHDFGRWVPKMRAFVFYHILRKRKTYRKRLSR